MLQVSEVLSTELILSEASNPCTTWRLHACNFWHSKVLEFHIYKSGRTVSLCVKCHVLTLPMHARTTNSAKVCKHTLLTKYRSHRVCSDNTPALVCHITQSPQGTAIKDNTKLLCMQQQLHMSPTFNSDYQHRSGKSMCCQLRHVLCVFDATCLSINPHAVYNCGCYDCPRGQSNQEAKTAGVTCNCSNAQHHKFRKTTQRNLC